MAAEQHVAPTAKVQVKVGWGMPDQDGELMLNFHFSSKVLDWNEVIPVYAVIELYELLIAESCRTGEVVFPTALTNGTERLAEMLAKKSEWSSANTNYLTGVTQKLEEWITHLFLHMKTTPSAVPQMVKQMFFRSVDKLAAFELLTAGPTSRRK